MCFLKQVPRVGCLTTNYYEKLAMIITPQYVLELKSCLRHILLLEVARSDGNAFYLIDKEIVH